MKKGKKENKKFSIKSYIRDFLFFVDKKLIKATGILLVIAILLIALSIQPMVTVVLEDDCVGACMDGVKLFSEYGSKLQFLLMTVVSGIVPYIHAPVIGFVGYLLNEVSSLAYIIKGYGYLPGIGLGIVPLILNIFTICLVTALAIYICRIVTMGYRITNIKNMNFTNFRIKVYEVMQKEEKIKELTEKRDKKIEKLQARKEKTNYLQILNVAIVVCVLQFISVIIQQILL